MSLAKRIGLVHEKGCGPRRATPQALDEFEMHFNLSLPSAYRDLLQEVNGGIPRLRRFTFRGKSTATVNAFFFLGKQWKEAPTENNWDNENLWDESAVARMQLALDVVPFANDGAGGLFVLMPEENNAVYWVDSTNGSHRRRLSDSFEDFVARLRA